jgi:multicomponent Na+:H+ antiporter subunit C
VSQTDLYTLAGSALFVIGLYGLMTRPHLLHKVLALNISSAGVFFVFVGIARRVPGTTPDPLPHAMVLTGIVVTVSSTAFALALAKRIYSETGTAALDESDVDVEEHDGD